MEELKARKSSAFKQVYHDHYGMVKHFVLKNNGSDDDAGDVFQDGLVIVYEKLNTPGFALSCSLKTFLYAVCRNIWLNKLRINSRIPASVKDFETLHEVPDYDEEGIISQQNFTRVEKALKQLGERCQKLLESYYFLKLSMKQIAESMEYTNEDNAKNQKYKCLQQLKLLVKN